MHYHCCSKLIVLISIINCAFGISHHRSDQSAEILWNLSNRALSSKQNFPKAYYYNFQEKYPTLPYKDYYNTQNQYGIYKPNNFYNFYRPHGPISHLLPTRETFMDALDSVAKNDDLQCVPKLLCEITSGTLSARQNNIQLPFNVNMESLVGLLSTINSGGMSPLLHFGKAALLGYTSKGNTYTCNSAYPNCPADPDRLVQYLNNHNGGFFRFFNGINNNQPTYAANNFYYKNNNQVDAEARIQTRPSYEKNEFSQFVAFRDPKRLNGNPLKFYNDQELDIQKPLPNHQASAMIFPDRTGTGNLRLDPEELRDDNRQSFAFENNNIIRFNPDLVNDAFYNKNIFGQNIQTNNNRENKGLFSFPSY